MAREYGDDLAIIFVESQNNHELEKIEAFAWRHKWMGTSAMWTGERPFNTGAKGIPNFALLSTDGTVLLMGNPLSEHSKIQDLIDAEIAKSKKAPEDTPKSLKKAWKEFGKGNYAKAIAEARKVEAKSGDDSKAATDSIETFFSRAEKRLQQVSSMVENGEYVQAMDRLSMLAKVSKGVPELDERVAELNEQLGSADLKPEIDAAKALAKLEKMLYEDGFKDKLMKRVESFAKKYEGTRAGERAGYLVELSLIED